MRKLWTAVLIAGIAFVTVVAGCGGGSGPSNPGPPAGETVVTGIVKDNRTTPLPVQGVLVTLGTLSMQTGIDGRFSFDLGNNVPVRNLFSDPTEAVIKVSTKLIADQYPEVNVFYGGTGYEQPTDQSGASIPLPFEVYSAQGTTADLGTITVQWIDPDNPPPKPY